MNAVYRIYLAILASILWFPSANAMERCVGDPNNQWNLPGLYDYPTHQAYMKKVEAALGTFDDINVWEWREPDGTNGTEAPKWEKLIGEYIPVTFAGKTPEAFHSDMRSDRPMMLPTRVEGFNGGDGQSNPFSVVGRMPGSNPEVQWVFLVRKYYLRKETDKKFVYAGDVAIIGHHPRTGASTYFQFYNPKNPKPAQVVVSPFNGKKGMCFWSPLVTNAKVFQCQRCHNADPFVHTPWIDQVRVSKPEPGKPFPEPMVPSNPLGAFYFVGDDDGELFAFWDSWLQHLDAPQNKCTSCHRVTPFDLSGLYQHSTQYAGVPPDKYNTFAVEMHSYQTDQFYDLPWMPPVNIGDFYAGQRGIQRIWHQVYSDSAKEVNQLTPEDSVKLRKVPRPDKQYQHILVDRPNLDTVSANHAVWVVDSRMRANTDSQLSKWQFISKPGTSPEIVAAPVVFRRHLNDGSSTQFDIAFIGEPRNVDDSEKWVDILESELFELKQGDYLGMVMFNEGGIDGQGVIPYTDDEWAKIKLPNGVTRFPDGVVTYSTSTNGMLIPGETLTFDESNYRTYSFEMQSQLQEKYHPDAD